MAPSGRFNSAIGLKCASDSTIYTRALPRAAANYYTIRFNRDASPRTGIEMYHALPYFARACGFIFALYLAVMAPGCGGDAVDTTPPPLNPDEAMAQWRSLMASPDDNLENPDLKLLAETIGQSAPQYVDEMIAEFDDPALSDEKLIVLVASMEAVVSPEMIPRLAELTDPGKPDPVRGAATYLIGLIQSPEAEASLEALRDDEYGTVRLSALLGLSDRGDDDARQSLRDIYNKESTTAAVRERILLTVTQVPNEADRAIYELGIQTKGFEQHTYLMAVSALGRVGSVESIGPLSALKSRPDCSVAVRDMCDNTIAAIEERSKHPAETNPS